MTPSDPLRLVGVTLARRYVVESVVRVEEDNVVYRATHTSTGRSFAVRALTALAGIDEAKRRALHDALVRDHAKLAELSAIAPGAHPMRDVGTVDTPRGAWIPYVVLAWPHGLTLEQSLATRHGEAFPASLAEVAALLEPVAVALSIAHEHGVVHGAIRADRVLLRDEDAPSRTMLLDFGIARTLHALDHGDPTIAEDVRALADLLSRAIARAGSADADAYEAPRGPRARGVFVEDAVEAIFARAFGTDPFASVGEMWSAVRRSLDLAPLRSMEATLPPEPAPASSSQQSRSLRPTSQSTPPPPPREARTARRTHVLWAIAGSAALVAIGIGTARRDSRAPSTPRAAGAESIVDACNSTSIAIAPATYRTGAAGDADDPARAVTLGGACIDREAVTVRDYAACSDRGACQRASRTNEWDGIDDAERDALDPLCRARDAAGNAASPINCVTWEMASAYCAARGARLPTEAEWEIASRATGASIAEWVSDWRAPIAPGAAGGPQVDPRGPARGDERVVRGAHGEGERATRFGAPPTTRSHAIGFRCAEAPAGVTPRR